MHFEKKMKRDNVERAEETGMLDHEKLAAGAPLDWMLVTGEEIEAILACGLPFVKRLGKVQGPIGLGWAPRNVYNMIVKWEELGENYAGLSLTEWLKKTCG